MKVLSLVGVFFSLILHSANIQDSNRNEIFFNDAVTCIEKMRSRQISPEQQTKSLNFVNEKIKLRYPKEGEKSLSFCIMQSKNYRAQLRKITEDHGKIICGCTIAAHIFSLNLCTEAEKEYLNALFIKHENQFINSSELAKTPVVNTMYGLYYLSPSIDFTLFLQKQGMSILQGLWLCPIDIEKKLFAGFTSDSQEPMKILSLDEFKNRMIAEWQNFLENGELNVPEPNIDIAQIKEDIARYFDGQKKAFESLNDRNCYGLYHMEPRFIDNVVEFKVVKSDI